MNRQRAEPGDKTGACAKLLFRWLVHKHLFIHHAVHYNSSTSASFRWLVEFCKSWSDYLIGNKTKVNLTKMNNVAPGWQLGLMLDGEVSWAAGKFLDPYKELSVRESLRKEMIKKGVTFLDDNQEVMRVGGELVGDPVDIVDSSESDEDVVNEFPILRHPVDAAE